MNYSNEIIKILASDDEARNNYGRICAVASAVARDDDNFLPYVWAYLSGKSDWKKLENYLKLQP